MGGEGLHIADPDVWSVADCMRRHLVMQDAEAQALC